MKCLIYARVSTNGGEQDPESQLIQLRAFAAQRKWTVVEEYVDYVSGSKASRPALDRMLADARAGKADVVLAWALDRLSREGIHAVFQYIQNFKDWGVAFESLTEPHFSTTGPSGELMLAIAAWIAKIERERISDRVKAGLARASSQGRKGGQPKRAFDRARAREMRAAGVSYRKIGAILGVPHTTVRDACTADAG